MYETVLPGRDSKEISRGELIAMVGRLRGQLYDYLCMLRGEPGDFDFDEARLLWDTTAFDVQADDEPTDREKDRAHYGGRGPYYTAAEIDELAAKGVVMRPWKEYYGLQLRGLLSTFIREIVCERTGEVPPTFKIRIVGKAPCADTNVGGRELSLEVPVVEVGEPGDGLTAEQTAILGVMRRFVEHEVDVEGVRVDGQRVLLSGTRIRGARVDNHEGCCVCGRTTIPHPDTELARQLGHTPPSPEAVAWRCAACHRKVCRDHVYVVQTDLPRPFHEEIPVDTLCTEPTCVRARKWNGAPLAQQHPTIVCLCGSSRFFDAFARANYEETMAGRIVLSIGFVPHTEGLQHGETVGCNPAQKIALDNLHKRKIDLCDEVLVLNVGGYIGDSTRSELEHARRLGKPIRWLEPPSEGQR